LFFARSPCGVLFGFEFLKSTKGVEQTQDL